MIALSSPAKINLFLKILGKRSDGYHDIVSLFQTISLADTVTIRESDRDQITCSQPDIPLNHDNIVMRALILFRQKTAARTSFHIHIDKHIPIGAGLGGGSSNAATALFGFNSFLKNPLTIDELHDIAKHVGSDVPFFLSEGSSICRQRGEVVQPVLPLLSGKLFVVMPDVSLSTRAVYETLDIGALKQRTLPEIYSKENLEYFNDLEEPAFKLYPRLKLIKEELAEDAPVIMTGSGSALIVLTDAQPKAPKGCRVHPAHFITRKQQTWYTLA